MVKSTNKRVIRDSYEKTNEDYREIILNGMNHGRINAKGGILWLGKFVENKLLDDICDIDNIATGIFMNVTQTGKFESGIVKLFEACIRDGYINNKSNIRKVAEHLLSLQNSDDQRNIIRKKFIDNGYINDSVENRRNRDISETYMRYGMFGEKFCENSNSNFSQYKHVPEPSSNQP